MLRVLSAANLFILLTAVQSKRAVVLQLMEGMVRLKVKHTNVFVRNYSVYACVICLKWTCKNLLLATSYANTMHILEYCNVALVYAWIHCICAITFLVSLQMWRMTVL